MDNRELAFNFKAIMMFERLSGESYFEISEENYIYLLYTMYMVKHPNLYMEINDFANIMGNNKKITKKIMQEFSEYMNYIRQYMIKTSNDNSDKPQPTETTKPTLTDIAFYLITNCGLDCHYVMYEMELWEIEPFYKHFENKKKEELETERLWTYLSMSPHIDTKKCKSPDKILPFPWEKEEKKIKTNKELENNRFAIQNMIGKNIFGEPIKPTENNG